MKKYFLALLCVCFVFIFSACESSEPSTEVEVYKITDIENTGVLTFNEGSYIKDNNNDGLVGNEKDEIIDSKKAENNLGLKTTLKVNDENDNGSAEFGEKLYIEVIIENVGEENYYISNVAASVNSLKFDSSNTVLETENTGDLQYEFVDGAMYANNEDVNEFILEPGATAKYKYFVLVKDLEEDDDAMSVLGYPRTYVQFSYEANYEDEPVNYFEFDDQQVLNYSGNSI